jgi:hypothetical protein
VHAQQERRSTRNVRSAERPQLERLEFAGHGRADRQQHHVCDRKRVVERLVERRGKQFAAGERVVAGIDGRGTEP